MISQEPAPLSPTKLLLLERLRTGLVPLVPPEPEGPRRRGASVAPMSFSQEQIWLALQRCPSSPVYTEPVTVRCRGPLDVDAFRGALSDVVARHEAWRTTFALSEGQPVQRIQAPSTLDVPLTDLSGLPRHEAESAALQLAQEDAAAAMDLERGPLLRARLARIEADEHWLLLTLHHLIFDGVTLYNLFLPELTRLYEARRGPLPMAIPEPALQYADYAAWQRETVTREALAEHLTYWRDRLAGAPAHLALPFDRAHPAQPSFAGSFEPVDLGGERTAGLRGFSRRHGVTPFTTLLTGFAILLRRYSGQGDMVVGSVSAGRGRCELQDIFGCFINLLPLRLDVPDGATVSQAIAHVRDAALDAQSHDCVPFEMLVGELGAGRGGARNPLFDVMFVLEPPRAQLTQDWDVRPLEADTGTAKFDLSLVLEERASSIGGRFEYSTELFERSTIQRLLRHWMRILDEMIRNPDQAIDRLPLLSRDELHVQLVARNATEAPYPNQPIHRLFERQVETRAESVALVAGERSVTYRELNCRANALARRLVRTGVRRGDRVAILLERTPDLIVSILATLKAGAAYLPLDPSSPPARLEFMLEDAAPAALIAGPEVAFEGPRLDLDVVDEAGHSGNLSVEVSPDDPAYVMYTSGSTGQPKGVEATHRGITRLLFGVDYADFGPDRVFLHGAPVCFDIAAWEVWGALLHGGRCVLPSERVLSPATIREAIRRHGVDTVIMTASLFNSILDEAPDALAGLHQAIVGGEPLSPVHIRKAYACLPDIRLINGYGPTETGVLACCWPIPRDLDPGATHIPIGRPIGNTRAYVLDRYGQPVPDGAAGELYIGGDGLARGYLNRPSHTAERFVPDPFLGEANARMYRTGDLVRYRSDGLLEFLGRVDSQVKVRGFRVELGEIESVLAAQPDVQAVAVVARKHELGQTRLVAYAVPSGPLDTSALLAAARARLPEYMVPADVVLLDRLPLGPTGKLDVAALPAPAREARPAQATHQPPRDEVELTLRRLFQELLHTEEVGPSDNFFSLGGDSLLAVRLLARISNGFSVDLPLSCMWDGASVAYLADLVRGGATRSDAHSGLKWLRQGSKRPFFCAAPLDGNPFRFAQLAQHFDEDRPFVALKATWEDEWVGPEGTVESVAAAYIPELRLVQRHGPYLLGGYSFGGAVAYELARQLAATGEEVGLLAMIDCGPSHWSLSPRWKSPRAALNALANLPGWLSEAAGRSWREWHDSLRQELSMFRARFRAAPASEDPADLERLWRMDALPAEYRDFLRGCFRALVSYTPAPYDGSVTLLRARSQSLIRPPDRRLGWGPFVRGGVEVLDVPGTHLSSLREPNVRTVAAILNEHLRRADTSPLAA